MILSSWWNKPYLTNYLPDKISTPTLSRLGKIECRMRMGFNKISRSQTTRNSGGEMKQSTYSGESKKHTTNLHSGTEITLLKCRGNPQTRTHRPEYWPSPVRCDKKSPAPQSATDGCESRGGFWRNVQSRSEIQAEFACEKRSVVHHFSSEVASDIAGGACVSLEGQTGASGSLHVSLVLLI